MSDERVNIELDLTGNQAWELAQFAKRVGWREMRNCAVDDDEAYAIRDAIDQLGKALARAGYAPR